MLLIFGMASLSLFFHYLIIKAKYSCIDLSERKLNIVNGKIPECVIQFTSARACNIQNILMENFGRVMWFLHIEFDMSIGNFKSFIGEK